MCQYLPDCSRERRMVRIALAVLALLLLALAGACLWQEARYLRIRREIVQDRQPILHGDVFHVLTLLELAPGAELFGAVRRFGDAVESGGGGRVVYAGKVALDALSSKQLTSQYGEEVRWSAVVLAQYASPAQWERGAASAAMREALGAFARHHSTGMERSAAQNLALPLVLLGVRARQIVSGAPSHFPFERAEDLPELVERLAIPRLAAERELGARAAVVVNLNREGTAEEQAADRRYVAEMFGLMAEGVHGPMHVGRAVRLEGEGEAAFDRVALVYYPGVDYFADMARSRFYRAIVGGKQLGDAQASITVPILDRL
jgi:hypothetical protein